MARRINLLPFLVVVCLIYGCLGCDSAGTSTEASPTVAGPPIVVDNFEDGDLVTPVGAKWYKITDAQAGGKSSSRGEVIDGGAAGSKKAMRIAGTVTTDFAHGFAGAGVTLDPRGAARDLSGYTGVKFFARGDGGMFRIAVPRAAIKDHNEYGKEFTPSKDWTPVTITFAQMAQSPYFGTKVAWSAKDIKGVEFTTVGAPRPNFFLDVDQITFY